MAKAEIKKQVVVSLTLTEAESKYLTGLLQNYLMLDHDEEPVDQHEMRRSIWTALNSANREVEANG